MFYQMDQNVVNDKTKMMNYTKKILLRMDKIAKSTGEAPICLRITIGRKTTYKTLYKIRPEYWDENKMQVKKAYPNAANLNAIISKKTAEIEREIIRLDSDEKLHDVSAVRDKLHERNSYDLFGYADQYLEKKYREGYATYKTYRSVITKFRNYVGKATLPVNEINPGFMRKYQDYLENELGNSRNTTVKNLKILSSLIREFYQSNDLEYPGKLFAKCQFKKEKTERGFLEVEELERIEDFKCKPHSPFCDAREIFLFQCYTGLRISDALALKWKNYQSDRLRGVAHKTGKAYDLVVIKQAAAILARRRRIVEKAGGEVSPEAYIFNILRHDIDTGDIHEVGNDMSAATARINKKLKTLMKKVGIEKNVSTHVARHTFATWLITKGADIFAVKELLQHSDVRETQIYAKMIDAKKQEAMKLLENN